ncbi:hypothetical protein E2C01_003949 [Portunus trituberculatus]|uniref:Uncharacterized protein n=1 Tax=Portunus trituberculatus TaxID=210409 RepID=A0A5B7CNK4_PORTR|nr:hypothetical protein [Portunus trituberculatus]
MFDAIRLRLINNSGLGSHESVRWIWSRSVIESSSHSDSPVLHISLYSLYPELPLSEIAGI